MGEVSDESAEVGIISRQMLHCTAIGIADELESRNECPIPRASRGDMFHVMIRMPGTWIDDVNTRFEVPNDMNPYCLRCCIRDSLPRDGVLRVPRLENR